MLPNSPLPGWLPPMDSWTINPYGAVIGLGAGAVLLAPEVAVPVIGSRVVPVLAP